jgi:hypothetical protein
MVKNLALQLFFFKTFWIATVFPHVIFMFFFMIFYKIIFL